MNCRELREYLIAFLNSEVEAALSIEVQLHLEQCPECAREAEFERAIRRQLSKALVGSPGVEDAAITSDLDRMVAAITANENQISTRGRRGGRWPVRFAAAAVLGFAVLGGILWFEGRSHHTTNQFVDLLTADFQHFQANRQPLQVASSNPGEVSNWLAAQTVLTVTLPKVEEKEAKLLGARKCQIAGKPAALAAYNINGSLATLVVVPGAHPDVDNMARVEHDGHTHWVDRCKGHTVLACKRGPLVYAAVSKLSEDRLLALMANPDR